MCILANIIISHKTIKILMILIYETNNKKIKQYSKRCIKMQQHFYKKESFKTLQKKKNENMKTILHNSYECQF